MYLLTRRHVLPPSYSEEWRDIDWFKTRVPNQTQKRPHFIQSVIRPVPSTLQQRTPQLNPIFMSMGGPQAHVNSEDQSKARRSKRLPVSSLPSVFLPDLYGFLAVGGSCLGCLPNRSTRRSGPTRRHRSSHSNALINNPPPTGAKSGDIHLALCHGRHTKVQHHWSVIVNTPSQQPIRKGRERKESKAGCGTLVKQQSGDG